MGSSSKKGTKVNTPAMPAMPQAPYYGASLAEMEDYSKYQSGFDEYKKQKSSGKYGKKLSKQPGFEDVIRGQYERKHGKAPERPGAYFDKAMKENFQKAWSADAGKEYQEALFNQMREPITQDMFGRGLGAGTEINDTALMKAKMAALLGAHQMVGQDRQQSLGLTDRGYQASTLPYMNLVDRQNLKFSADSGAAKQASANAAGNKQSAMTGITGIGSAFLGK